MCVVALLACSAAAGSSLSFFYADNGLQSVVYKTASRSVKRDVQMEILHLLGLEDKPHLNRPAKRNSSAPKYLLDLYNMMEREEGGEEEARVTNSDYIVSFNNKIDELGAHFRHEKTKMFYFDVGDRVAPDEDLVSAELRVYKRGKHPNKCGNRGGKKHLLTLYAVSEETNDANTKTLDPVAERVMWSAECGWISLNVTRPLQQWIAFPRKNLGLYLKIKSLAKPHRSVDPHEIGLFTSNAGTLDEYKPFMVAFFRSSGDRRKVRTTRAARKKEHDDHSSYNPYAGFHMRTPSSRRRSCERLTLYVSFRDLGFQDFIIAPDGYSAYFCDGACNFPLNSHMNATNHAIVKTLVHLMDPAAVPKPSCAPTHLSAITVLYFDDSSNVILKKYRNMVVKACGCH